MSEDSCEDVQQKIDRGLEASERGDFISDEEIERRIADFILQLGVSDCS